jgi:hypothetical protein
MILHFTAHGCGIQALLDKPAVAPCQVSENPRGSRQKFLHDASWQHAGELVI